MVRRSSSVGAALLIGLVVGAAVTGVGLAGDVIDPLRQPPPSAQIGLDPAAIDPAGDRLRADHLAGERLAARECRLRLRIGDRRLTFDGERARAHRLGAGERITVRLGERATVRWGVTDGPPTWDRTLDRPVGIEPGDRVTLVIERRGSNLTVSRASVGLRS